jgi:hypothetical protein
MNNWCICWFSKHIFTEILIFEGLIARRLYKSFGVKGLRVTASELETLTHHNTAVTRFSDSDHDCV